MAVRMGRRQLRGRFKCTYKNIFPEPLFVSTINLMQIEFDRYKRDRTLAERGLDFARATEAFAGHHYTMEDGREDHGELRCITIGKLDDRMIVMVWTPRGKARRIISMRKANEREPTRYPYRMDGSG